MSVFSARGFGRGFGIVSGAISPLLLLAPAAQADIAAQDVWSDWKSYMTASGYEISATESLAAGILTVSDIAMTMNMPEAEGFALKVMIDTLKFEEMGDGTVQLRLPQEFPIRFSAADENGGASGEMLYTHDGAPLIMSGDQSTITYDYETEQSSVLLSDLDIQGDEEDLDIFAEMTLSGLVHQSETSRGDLRSLDQSSTADKVSYTLRMASSEEDGTVDISGTMEDLVSNTDATLPGNISTGADFDFAEALKAGLSYAVALSYGASSSSVKADMEGDSFLMQTKGASGVFNGTLGMAGFAYEVTQSDVDLSVLGSDIPFPISLSMEEMGANIAMPLSKSDEEQDFGLGIAMRELQIPDMIWGLFDPTGELPHDPATLVLDLSGKAKLLMDLANEEEMAAVEAGEELPGELHGLTLNELLLTAVGAELSGTGDFTFDNGDLETFDGFPAPNGEANLKLVGANALIDKLIAMGFVSDSDAMGARMMMGLFTTPGAGEDTLTSRIEVRDGGQVLANGQRLR